MAELGYTQLGHTRPSRGAYVGRRQMKLGWLIALNVAVCTVLCGLCIAYVDKPTALFVAQNVTFKLPFQAMAAPSLLALPLSLIFLAIAAIRASLGQMPLPQHSLYLRLSLATLAATAAKDELKWLFGRSWPGSLIHYNIYAFAPFASSPLYGGFPSGHTAYISAPLLLLCALKPHYTPVWLTIIALVMTGLIGGGYHFPGDTIAGLFTGLASAAGVWGLMRGV